MEHDQAITSREWCAYVAGFFDGEGTIMITRREASRSGFNVNHQVWIGVAQRVDHRDVLDDIRETFNGAVRVLNRNKVNPRWSDIAQWELIARPLQRQFLTTLRPFLRVKSVQADLALEFLDTVETYGRMPRRNSANSRLAGTGRLTDDQIAVREGFRIRMTALNRLGPRLNHG